MKRDSEMKRGRELKSENGGYLFLLNVLHPDDVESLMKTIFLTGYPSRHFIFCNELKNRFQLEFFSTKRLHFQLKNYIT